MQVDFQDLDVLLDIQRIDLLVMQAKKARAELPQRIEVVKVRKKRDEISPKLDKVLELQRGVEARITQVEDEDRMLAEKQERAQEDIDKAGSDYRKVESHSKDLAGLAKRRATLEEQMGELSAELEKVLGVKGQLEAALAVCDKKEADLRASFQDEDNELIDRIKGLLGERAERAAKLPADLMKLYDTTAAKTGGVGIGKLEEDHCGVCRSAITGGRLIELRAQAPLGTCPNCKRLLIIED